MTIKDLEKEIPGLAEYTKTMPEEIRKKPLSRFILQES